MRHGGAAEMKTIYVVGLSNSPWVDEALARIAAVAQGASKTAESVNISITRPLGVIMSR
jgi:hypothetical protein